MNQKIIVKLCKTIFPLVVSSGAVYYLLAHVISVQNLKEVLYSVSYEYLILAIAITIVANMLLALRWRTLLSLNGHSIPYKRLIHIFAANLPIAKFTPGYTGDFLRSFFLRKEVPVPLHIGIIFSEALYDIATLALIAWISSIFINNTHFILITSGILLSMILLLTLIKFNFFLPIIRSNKIYKFIQAIQTITQVPSKMVPVFFLTLCISFLSPLYVYTLFQSVGAEISFATVLAIQPIVIMITLVPISLWGIGIRETAMLVLYAGVASEHLITTGFLYTLVGSVLIPLLCIPYTYTTIREVLHSLKSEKLSSFLS